jgi:hypothetical protein
MSLEWLCISGKLKRTVQFDISLLKTAQHLTWVVVVAQLTRINAKDLLFNEYAIHIGKSNIVSTTNLTYISVSLTQLDASIKACNFVCVLNCNQWWVDPLFVIIFWLVSFIPKPMSCRSNGFLQGSQVLYMITVEGFVHVSACADLLKSLWTCAFAHYSANFHIHLNTAYTLKVWNVQKWCCFNCVDHVQCKGYKCLMWIIKCSN